MLRQLDKVDAVCTQLEQVHAPIASYYRGLAAQRFNLDHAQRLFEQAAKCAPREFQARALLALGSLAEHQENYSAARGFYRQVLELKHNDAYTAVETRRAIAIRLFAEGEQGEAIRLLESVVPLAQHHPYLCGQLLNHLAVYYHQNGRLQEAVRLAEFVCRSPLVSVYHEWQETKEEAAADLAAQQARAIIISIPELQHEDSDASEPPHVEYPRLVIMPAFAAFAVAGMILSRFRYSIHPHAPPILSGK